MASDNNTLRKDLGAVSAYAVAVEHGFDGTEAEWEEYIANASNNAAAANTSKLAAEGYAVGKQNGEDVPSTSPYYENNAKYYAEQTEAAKTTAVQAIEAKGEQVLHSIPSEYTELSGDVADLKSAFNSHTSEITALENQVAKKADVLTSDETESDLDITDRAGNVILRLADGGIETKNFNSATMTQAVENLDERVADLEEDPVEMNVDVASTTKTGVDLDVTDRTGNVLLRLASGHIQTKEFDSEEVLQSIDTLSEKMWTGKKWAAVGDSLTEVNQRTTKHYHDYIAEATGITVVNLGHSGAGYYARPSDYTFRRRVNDVPLDSDVVTIFGSGNDIGKEPLGEVTDTEATTLCGCINITLDNLYARMPVVQLGIITPTPWINLTPITPGNAMDLYCEAIVEICRRRSIPCLDLYHCSNLRPDDATFRQLAYSKDDGGGVHPDETGHFLIASRFKAFLSTLLL